MVDSIIARNQDRRLFSHSLAAPIYEYQVNTFAANTPNEDRFTSVVNDSGAYFSVLDGHGGSAAVIFLHDHLISYIQDTLKRYISEPSDSNVINTIKAALISAYERADRDFIWSGNVDEHHLAAVYSGSCVITAYCVGQYLFIANCGDCRAVLGRRIQGKIVPIQLSNDHTAEAEIERLRREHPNEPDVVYRGAIKGNLEPSRAFGDALLKDKLFNRYLQPEYQMPQPFTPPYITATPEIVVHRLERGDEFLLLASDGLWDRIDNQEAVDIVVARYGEKNVCSSLIRRVLEKSSPNGSSEEERVVKSLQLDPKERRKYHDDITIEAIFFDESRFDEVSRYQLRAEYFRPDVRKAVNFIRRWVNRLQALL